MDHVDHQHQDIEEALRSMNPAELDDTLLERLADAAGGSLGVLGEESRELEGRLAALKPAELPPSIVGGFLERVREVPFPLDEKVVPFQRAGSAEGAAPASSPATSGTVERRRRRAWPAVAAALVAGVFTALMVPSGEKASPPVSAAAPGKQEFIRPAGGELVPAGMGTDLNEARDLGVVWSADRRPMRVIRVIYKDRVEFRDENGKKAVVEVPRVEHILTPAEVE